MGRDNFIIVHDLNEEMWRHFLSSHPYSNIFMTPEFFHIFSHTKNLHPEIWCCLSNQGEILVLFIPVMIHISHLPSYRFTRAIAYGDILVNESKNESKKAYSALNHLLLTYRQKYDKKILFTEIRKLYNTSHCHELFCSSGFIFHDYLNYLIDLQKKPEEIFSRFGKNAQKQIKRASRKGQIMIKEITCIEDLPTVYRLLRMTYRYKHVPLADFSLFEQAFRILWPKRAIQILLAYDEGIPVATSIELFYQTTIYGWYAGTDRQNNRHYTNELLMWEILRRGAESGYHVYDFGGAGYPHEPYGVRDFKAKFGGTLVNYGRYFLIHSPFWYQCARSFYKGYQRLPIRFPIDF